MASGRRTSSLHATLQVSSALSRWRLQGLTTTVAPGLYIHSSTVLNYVFYFTSLLAFKYSGSLDATFSVSLKCFFAACQIVLFFFCIQCGPSELCRPPEEPCGSLLERKCPQGVEGNSQEKCRGWGQKLHNWAEKQKKVSFKRNGWSINEIQTYLLLSCIVIILS